MDRSYFNSTDVYIRKTVCPSGSRLRLPNAQPPGVGVYIPGDGSHIYSHTDWSLIVKGFPSEKQEGKSAAHIHRYSGTGGNSIAGLASE